MKLSVEIEHGQVEEVHPVIDGMLCDGLNTINTRWLARAAECVQAVRRTGECQTMTIRFHPLPCGLHGREAIP